MGYSLGRVYHPSGKLLLVNSILIQHHASCLFAGCQLRSLLALAYIFEMSETMCTGKSFKPCLTFKQQASNSVHRCQFEVGTP